MNYWLMKSEPDVFGIHDLEKDGVTSWDGVRNYQARNFMRDEMKLGDQVLFYHSNCKVPGIVGVAQVCKESYPDHTSWDKSGNYYDEKSSAETPRWFMVDVKWGSAFSRIVSLEEIKNHAVLKEMLVAKKGQRLSIQPVEKKHFNKVVSLGSK